MIDPNKELAQLRTTLGILLGAYVSTPVIVAYEAFNNLDTHLKAGGAPPDDWNSDKVAAEADKYADLTQWCCPTCGFEVEGSDGGGTDAKAKVWCTSCQWRGKPVELDPLEEVQDHG